MATFFSVLAQILFWAVMIDLAIGVILALIDMYTSKDVKYFLATAIGFYFVVVIAFAIVELINGFCFHSLPW